MKLLIRAITESEDQLRAQLQHPEYFAEKTAGLRSGSRRLREVLATRVMLKELFGGQEQRVTYDAHGAPSLAPTPGVTHHLSISHTDGYAAVLLSTTSPVGVDIERRGPRVKRVVSHFLKPEEVELLQRLSADEEQFVLSLHLAWSAKEAAYKVLGPAYYDLQRLTTLTSLDWRQYTLSLSVTNVTEPLRMSFSFTDDYVCVKCGQ